MSMDLKKIYNGSFASRQRFDDGGSAYTSYDSTGNATPYDPSGSGAPTASDISSLTSGSTQGPNSIQSEVGSNPMAAAQNPADSGSGSALKGALSFLGTKQGAATLQALLGVASGVGGMQRSQAYSKLPAMPQLPGMGNAGVSSGQYGPPGGYNWQNYKNLTSQTPGTGYAPRTQSAAQPAASYYTYGQGPEQQFFQQVNPQGGPIAPVTHKRGGRVKKFAIGGPAPQLPMTQPGALSQPVRPMMPMQQPSGLGVPQQPQMGLRPGVRPFAAGGQNEGALSAPEQGSRYVRGPGDGTSDDIPARLANGEYVLSADVVSGLGNGDNNSGAKVLDGFVHSLRTHKAENASKGKLPADAKPIHHYIKGGK